MNLLESELKINEALKIPQHKDTLLGRRMILERFEISKLQSIIQNIRSWERTRLVLDDLRKSSKNNDVHFIRLDLNDFKSVEEFVQELTSKYTR